MRCIAQKRETTAVDDEKLTDLLDVMIQLLSTTKR